MKNKILALLLAATMACCSLSFLAGCSGGSSSSSSSSSAATSSSQGQSSSSVVGTWKLKSVTANGQTVSGSSLGSYDYSFVFSDDGTCTLSVMGATITSPYKQDGDKITFSDGSAAEYDCTVSGNDLSFSAQGTTVTLARQ